MNEDTFVVTIIIVLVAIGCFFWGRAIGKHELTKPCDQFTQWQIKQRLEPVRCKP